MESEVVYWTLWLASAWLCFQMVAGAFGNPVKILEWPFVAGAISLYFYVYMALYARLYLHEDLDLGTATIGQFVVLTSLIALKCGWERGCKRLVHVRARAYSHYSVWVLGTCLVVLSTVVQVAFHARVRDAGGQAYSESSAYWYLFFYVGYPGLTLSLWALCKMEPGARRSLIWISIAVFAVFMFPYVYSARRGPLFPAVIILLFVPPFALRKSPRPLLVLTCLGCTGIAMLAFVEARTYIYNQRSWSDAVNNLSVSEVVTAKVTKAGDNEYVNCCYLIAMVYENGKYQYGTGHMELLVHWIPRTLWPDKPALGEGIYPHKEVLRDLDAYSGLPIMGSGAAAGGFADSFLQYGFVCPLFWYLISMYFGTRYTAASRSGSPGALIVYMALPCSGLWLLSQGFAAAFVPGMAFIVPAAALRFCAVKPFAH